MVKKIIKVDKEVLITDNYIKANKNDFVLNISDMNETEGFTQFVVVMNSTQQCCEDVGYVKDDNIFGRTLFVKELLFNKLNDEDIKRLTGEFIGLDHGAAREIVVRTLDKDYSFVFYNAHNGYYSHTIEMEYLKDGEIKFTYENWL